MEESGKINAMCPPDWTMLSAIAANWLPRPAYPSPQVPRLSCLTRSSIASCSSTEVPKAAKAGFFVSTWSAAWFVGVVKGGFMMTRLWLNGGMSTSTVTPLPAGPITICSLSGRIDCIVEVFVSSSSSEPISTTGLPFESRSTMGLPSSSRNRSPQVSRDLTPPNGYRMLRVLL